LKTTNTEVPGSIPWHSLGFFWGSWVWNGVHSASWSDKLSSYLNKEVTVRFGKLKMQLWDSIWWPHVNPVPSGAVGKDCQRRLLSRPRFVWVCSATDFLFYFIFYFTSWDISVSIVCWLRLGFDPRQRPRIFSLASETKPAARPMQSRIQRIPGVKRGQGVTLTTHSPLVPRSKMREAIHPLPLSASMATERQLCFYILYKCGPTGDPGVISGPSHLRQWQRNFLLICSQFLQAHYFLCK
jgi:hypothetical protein